MIRTVLFFSAIFSFYTFTISSCTDDILELESPMNLGTVMANGSSQRGPQGNQGSAGSNNNQNNNSGTTSSGSSDAGETSSDCTNGNEINTDRAVCSATLSYSPMTRMSISGTTRTITANNIPDHKIGQGGPNSISPQSSTYHITLSPQKAGSVTTLLSSSGPAYSFGILLNGVEVDPVAAEPWPHTGSLASANWTWNLEAMHVRIGLDCNNAHVQPTGKYHYHGNPTLLIESMNISSNTMTLIGYAADGFPIYYKYGYANASNAVSGIKSLITSYRLKSGSRPGDGSNAPCGTYDGVYSNDFEYVEGLGDLDQCNGRTGVTPDYPEGTYYYVLTEDFPYIPRCFAGTPSNDFRIGF